MQNVSALLLIILLVIATGSCRKSDYEVDHVESIRDNGGGTGTTTWRKDRDYLLEGLVFVNDGQTLTFKQAR
jgi:hypothetical protein